MNRKDRIEIFKKKSVKIAWEGQSRRKDPLRGAQGDSFKKLKNPLFAPWNMGVKYCERKHGKGRGTQALNPRGLGGGQKNEKKKKSCGPG